MSRLGDIQDVPSEALPQTLDASYIGKALCS